MIGWHLTATSIQRAPAKPVFLLPWFWPQRIWKQCSCQPRTKITVTGTTVVTNSVWQKTTVAFATCNLCGHVSEGKDRDDAARISAIHYAAEHLS